MPFVNVKTNVPVSWDYSADIKTALGRYITAIPGKTEDWLMVGIEGDYDLYFRGTKEPAAMVEVSIFGGAARDAKDIFTSHVTRLLTDTLGIPADRVYVKYTETGNWGWNGSNL